MSEPSAFLKNEDGTDAADATEPHVFIQYKGTDICLDFNCECGAQPHFDGYFADVLKCPKCGAEWEMPQHLFPRKRCAGTYAHDAKLMEIEDDDDCDWRSTEAQP